MKTNLISKENLAKVLQAWKSKREHTTAEHIIYNILHDKPSNRGFTIKNRNIQGNDPWYGYNRHLWSLVLMTDVTIPKDLRSQFVEHATKRAANRSKQFQETFGIELTEEIHKACSLKSIKVENE